ncbi:GTP cyclohydrolase I [Halovenus amylolytica]|uniref:GTP cyclohydrolase I n=1 Tax=Halovenus amylolytica TaxID=2500550 RepID=UPI003606D167
MEKAQRGTKLLLEAIGEDPERGALAETWQRRVPDVLKTLSEGQRTEEKPVLRTFEADNEELVIKTGIPIYSLCEHHLLPFHGVAHIAYKPDGEVVGLSKLSRYVRWKARQLTMQEELTHEIATGLQEELGASSVLVELSATHLCEAMRGIETPTETTTRSTAGEPSEQDRQQFRTAIQRHD